MGAGLPSAIAAKLVHPERQVIAICGDGGFMMSSQELETATRLALHIVVLILNDNGYGMIRWKQEHMGLPEFGLSFGNPDFVKFAESFGAYGHGIAAADDLVPTLSRALESPGVHVIEVPVDYSENHRELDVELRERTKEV